MKSLIIALTLAASTAQAGMISNTDVLDNQEYVFAANLSIQEQIDLMSTFDDTTMDLFVITHVSEDTRANNTLANTIQYLDDPFAQNEVTTQHDYITYFTHQHDWTFKLNNVYNHAWWGITTVASEVPAPASLGLLGLGLCGLTLRRKA